MLATAAHTLATGKAPAGSISAQEIRALINQRLGDVITYPDGAESCG